MARKKRLTTLEKTEAAVLEHIPVKYQKSVIGVYRFGRVMNIVGILGMIFALISAFIIYSAQKSLDVNTIIGHVVFFALMLGLAVLGANYSKVKLNPPLIFGWAIIIGFISLILTIFFGVILYGILTTNLGAVYGELTIALVASVVCALFTITAVILLSAVYYLLFAHKGFMKWYKGYAKRNHIGEEAKLVKKKSKKKTEIYSDDDL